MTSAAIERLRAKWKASGFAEDERSYLLALARRGRQERRLHERLVDLGLAFHNERRYREALSLFRAAQKLGPSCPVAAYNVANTSHMLNRQQVAYDLLHGLVSASPESMRRGCPKSRQTPRMIKLDSYFLLFHVTLHLKGFCREAFGYAEKHLRLRRRGLESVWSRREVVAEIEAMRAEWREG